MKRTYMLSPLFALALPVVAAAQNAQPAPAEANDSGRAAAPVISLQPPITIQHLRPYDKRGLHMFESPKKDNVPYTGFKLDWGAAFTQQFQSLKHSNTAAAKLTNGANANQLIEIGSGFNNAVANLYLNAQLAPGIRVALESYLSARHHQESWVKDGYILMDASPIDNPVLNKIMEYTTLRVGHFEINYGDAHFRRSDNGNAIYNPFVGNLIMDAFTTEIGAELYVRKGALLAMVGTTAGESKGMVTTPKYRGWVKLAKLGVDQQLTSNVRVRLTGSLYTTDKSSSNTLYSGDRAGSRYYLVLEPTTATTTANAWSGNLQPGFKNSVTAMQLDQFVKIGNAELFGVIEQARGKASTETADRTWNQYAVDGVYRVLDEKLFVGARYNLAKGQLAGIPNKVSVKRTQLAGGWFVTPSILAKAEYVTQKYLDFPTSDIRNGGKFNGMVIEGVVAF